MNLQIKATRVFYENLESDKEINFNVGGGGSSKSYSLMQLMIVKAITEKRKKILIVRKTLPALKKTVWIPMLEMLSELNVINDFKIDRALLNMFYDGAFISFSGLDDVEKLKSSNWNYIWIEEATEITRKDFDVLRLYLREKSIDKKKNQIFLTFNPIDEHHWLKKVIDSNEYKGLLKVIHSTYKDNTFLDDASRARYESLAEQDRNLYRIYCLGEWGRLDNLVFTNWDIVEDVPDDGDVIYGIDPGFNDPTGVVRCVVKDKDVWVEEKLYMKGMTSSNLIDWLNRNIPEEERARPFFFDSQYPDRISEMLARGINAKPANKKVIDGINTMKSYRIHVLSNSTNIIKELRSYCWKTDRNGVILDEPVDFENHLVDAIRYALHSYQKRSGLVRIRWL